MTLMFCVLKFLKKNDMRILLTGSSSGLGRWIYECLPKCDIYRRGDSVLDFPKKHIVSDEKHTYPAYTMEFKEYDLIIHCAATISHCDWTDVQDDLFHDNVFLTRELTKIPHKKFVLISTIDEAKDSPYGVTKRISEIVVKELCDNYLIIRPSALLGKYMKKNTFQKIMHCEDIALTQDTVMNYILYEDVLDVALSDHDGVKVLRSNADIKLKEVANIFESDIKYGNIHYEVEYLDSDIDTKKTSEDNIRLYKDQYGN